VKWKNKKYIPSQTGRRDDLFGALKLSNLRSSLVLNNKIGGGLGSIEF
jgi:hypothetical protein